MQVVFVHGVSTRDLGDGEYTRWVDARTERLKRLLFGDDAEILNPYWGKYGLGVKQLKSLPVDKGGAETLNRTHPTSSASQEIVSIAKRDFKSAVATLSVAAISEVALQGSAADRRRVEDFWLGAAALADSGAAPDWLSQVATGEELVEQLHKHLQPRSETLVPLAAPLGLVWKPSFPFFDADAFIVDRGRGFLSGYLAQFLGDALMYFSRRDQSALVRHEICQSIVAAARGARDAKRPLVLIGYSMGGGVLHELLTDPEAVAAMEFELGAPLAIDLFLSVGTQIGMFAELKQFADPGSGKLLAVPAKHYWNVFDYNDPLAFLCAPVLPGVQDLEVSTAANVANAHGAYFENGLFLSRLKARLQDVGLIAS